MSRETREDRLVRNMTTPLAESLHELKNLKLSNPKEADIERWCHGVLKSVLGFSASAGYTIKTQESKGRMRADLVVLKGESPVLIVEVKKLDFDLDKSDFRSGKTQLEETVAQNVGARWGILCNGFEWRLYDFSNLTVGGVEVHKFNILGDLEDLDLSKKGIEEVAYGLADFNEVYYSSNEWNELSTEATAFSPDSIARAILSADVVKAIAKSIRGEHDIKTSPEILIDKVYDLLSKGLDDADAAWGPTKEAELQKFVKTQKRATRRRKRSVQKPDAVPTVADVNSVNPTHETAPVLAPVQNVETAVTMAAVTEGEKKSA